MSKRPKVEGERREERREERVDLALIYFFVPLEVTVGKQRLRESRAKERGRDEPEQNKQVNCKLTLGIGSDMRE